MIKVEVDSYDLKVLLRLASWAWSELSEGTGRPHETFERNALDRIDKALTDKIGFDYSQTSQRKVGK